jgi:hypothetical protein
VNRPESKSFQVLARSEDFETIPKKKTRLSLGLKQLAFQAVSPSSDGGLTPQGGTEPGNRIVEPHDRPLLYTSLGGVGKFSTRVCLSIDRQPMAGARCIGKKASMPCNRM